VEFARRRKQDSTGHLHLAFSCDSSRKETLLDVGIVWVLFRRGGPTPQNQSRGAKNAITLRCKSGFEKKKMGPGFGGGLFFSFGEFPTKGLTVPGKGLNILDDEVHDTTSFACAMTMAKSKFQSGRRYAQAHSSGNGAY
jgi:hypothetical protein